jgi:hypothetical protein
VNCSNGDIRAELTTSKADLHDTIQALFGHTTFGGLHSSRALIVNGAAQLSRLVPSKLSQVMKRFSVALARQYPNSDMVDLGLAQKVDITYAEMFRSIDETLDTL